MTMVLGHEGTRASISYLKNKKNKKKQNNEASATIL
jgi:hypothetical protein